MYFPPASLVACTRTSSAEGESVMPGSTGAQMTPALTPAAFSCRTASMRRSGRGRARLKNARQFRVQSCDGDVHEQRIVFRNPPQQASVAHDEIRLGDNTDLQPMVQGQLFQNAEGD